MQKKKDSYIDGNKNKRNNTQTNNKTPVHKGIKKEGIHTLHENLTHKYTDKIIKKEKKITDHKKVHKKKQHHQSNKREI